LLRGLFRSFEQRTNVFSEVNTGYDEYTQGDSKMHFGKIEKKSGD